MPLHPRLKSFFEGAHIALDAAYRRSMNAPDNCAGSVREHGIREALKLTVPSAARIFDGEIIDSEDRATGQLDGIVVHASGAALAGSEHEPRVVLAEGVLAVIESKSDLLSGASWAGVRSTWSRVMKMKRAYDPQAEAWLRTATAAPSDARIPFIVVGYKGWAKKESLEEHAVELVQMARAEYGGDITLVPPILVVQLDPPGFGGLVIRDRPLVVCNLCPTWRPFGIIWSVLTHSVQRFQALPVNFAGYIKPDDDLL